MADSRQHAAEPATMPVGFVTQEGPFQPHTASAMIFLPHDRTPQHEAAVLALPRHADDLMAVVIVNRPEDPEVLHLHPAADDRHRHESAAAPAEPHEYDAKLILGARDRKLKLPFKMVEHNGHHH